MIHKILDAIETGIMSPVSCSDLSFVLHWYSCAVLVVKLTKKIALEDLCLAFYLIHP